MIYNLYKLESAKTLTVSDTRKLLKGVNENQQGRCQQINVSNFWV